MRSHAGFTLRDLLAVLAVLALGALLLLPSCKRKGNAPGYSDVLAGARLNAMKLDNATHVQGIIRSLIFYSDANEDRFPEGTVLERFRVLVKSTTEGGRGLTAKFLVATNEVDPTIKECKDIGARAANLTVKNISYALLSTSDTEAATEWRNKINSQCVLVSDRKGNGDTYLKYGSIWDPKVWKGTMGFGDQHVSFEEDATISSMVNGRPFATDDIFTAPGIVMSGPAQ